MNRNIIKFSNNWNGKLNNKAFTTLRMHNPGKYIIGNIYQIEFCGKIQGDAVLKSKRTLTIQQLNEFVCYLDTGYNKNETISILQRMYPNVNIHTARFDFCLLVYQKNSSTIKSKPAPKQMYLPYKD